MGHTATILTVVRGIPDDPADRMMIATTRARDCPLLTADRTIPGHSGGGRLRAIDAAR